MYCIVQQIIQNICLVLHVLHAFMEVKCFANDLHMHGINSLPSTIQKDPTIEAFIWTYVSPWSRKVSSPCEIFAGPGLLFRFLLQSLLLLIFRLIWLGHTGCRHINENDRNLKSKTAALHIMHWIAYVIVVLYCTVLIYIFFNLLYCTVLYCKTSAMPTSVQCSTVL